MQISKDNIEGSSHHFHLRDLDNIVCQNTDPKNEYTIKIENQNYFLCADDSTKLKNLASIEMGCHIDGYAANAGTTLVHNM